MLAAVGQTEVSVNLETVNVSFKVTLSIHLLGVSKHP